MMTSFHRVIACAFFFVVIGAMTACLDSGSDSSSDTGSLQISVDPSTVTVGSLAFVRVSFSGIGFDDLEDQGVTVKVVLPAQLEYVSGSAVFARNSGASEITPVFSGAVPTGGDDSVSEEVRVSGGTYVVFSLPPNTLEDDEDGEIQFNTRATEQRTRVEVWADIDRGAISAFDPSTPGFDTEARQAVQIISSTAD